MIGARRDRHAGHARRGDGPADPPLVLPRALGRPERADADEPARMSFASASRSAAATSAASARRPSSSARGSPHDEAFAIMDRAWERGIHWFDTGDAYGGGAARRGSATGARDRAPTGLRADDEGLPLDDRRRRATPASRPTGSGGSSRAASSGSASSAIDLYLAHEPDPRDAARARRSTPSRSCAREGLIGAWGLSNYDAAGVEEALAARPARRCVQNSFSLLDRGDEQRRAPALRRARHRLRAVRPARRAAG